MPISVSKLIRTTCVGIALVAQSKATPHTTNPFQQTNPQTNATIFENITITTKKVLESSGFTNMGLCVYPNGFCKSVETSVKTKIMQCASSKNTNQKKLEICYASLARQEYIGLLQKTEESRTGINVEKLTDDEQKLLNHYMNLYNDDELVKKVILQKAYELDKKAIRLYQKSKESGFDFNSLTPDEQTLLKSYMSL